MDHIPVFSHLDMYTSWMYFHRSHTVLYLEKLTTNMATCCLSNIISLHCWLVFPVPLITWIHLITHPEHSPTLHCIKLSGHGSKHQWIKSSYHVEYSPINNRLTCIHFPPFSWSLTLKNREYNYYDKSLKSFVCPKVKLLIFGVKKQIVLQ